MTRLDTHLRRGQIAKAALDIILQHGVAAVTVRRVAAAVGISAAAMYRHYTNKAEILKAIMDEHQEFILAKIRKAKLDGRSPLDVMRRFYFMTMAMIERYCALPVLFSSDFLWFKEPQLRAVKIFNHSTLRAIIITMISKAQHHGELRTDIRANEIAISFIGLFAIPALFKSRATDDMDLPRQIEANWALFINGVAAANDLNTKADS
jgi:AcrR family transcriptional regulator